MAQRGLDGSSSICNVSNASRQGDFCQRPGKCILVQRRLFLKETDAMKRKNPEREALQDKARSRHSRKHPDLSATVETSDQGILSQVQGAVTGAASAMGRAAMVAIDAVKDAVSPNEAAPLPSATAK